MKIVITGGGGFVGSHAALTYAQQGHEVVIIDSLARGRLLKKDIPTHNWDRLEAVEGVTRVKGDICDFGLLKDTIAGADAIIHTAAQTAVTTSVVNPVPDFASNAIGTFHVLEAARQQDIKTVVYASTNKVYGENVNAVPIVEEEQRYAFDKVKGITEEFSIDRCEHTPYGCSKLTGDLYAQDYGHLYGLRTGVFRMSCIYGTHQFGVEDQGWVAWFTIATLMNKPITIFGDGKQVRDVLYVSDLVNAYDTFIKSKVKHGVWNTGGGPSNTMSLLELLDILEEATGKRAAMSFGDWRPSDQKVYISDITKIGKELGWKPTVGPKQGVQKLVEWVQANKQLF